MYKALESKYFLSLFHSDVDMKLTCSPNTNSNDKGYANVRILSSQFLVDIFLARHQAVNIDQHSQLICKTLLQKSISPEPVINSSRSKRSDLYLLSVSHETCVNLIRMFLHDDTLHWLDGLHAS